MNKSIFKSTNFLAVIACLLWASAFVGIKIGLKYHTPLQFAGFRFTISGLLLMAYFGNMKKYWQEIKAQRKYVLKIMFFQTVLQYALFYSGINLLPASASAMIIGASPLVTAVLAHFMMNNDKLSKFKVLSLLMGLIGVVVIAFTKEDSSAVKTISVVGVLILLCNNLVGSYANVLVAKNSNRMSPIVLSSSTLFFGGITLTLISIPIEGFSLHDVKPEYFLSLVWLSFLSAVAFAIWYSLLRRPGVKVSELNIWKFLVPVVGAILAWIIIPTESVSLIAVLGMLFIAISLLVMNYANRKKL